MDRKSAQKTHFCKFYCNADVKQWYEQLLQSLAADTLSSDGQSQKVRLQALFSCRQLSVVPHVIAWTDFQSQNNFDTPPLGSWVNRGRRLSELWEGVALWQHKIVYPLLQLTLTPDPPQWAQLTTLPPVSSSHPFPLTQLPPPPPPQWDELTLPLGSATPPPPVGSTEPLPLGSHPPSPSNNIPAAVGDTRYNSLSVTSCNSTVKVTSLFLATVTLTVNSDFTRPLLTK